MVRSFPSTGSASNLENTRTFRTYILKSKTLGGKIDELVIFYRNRNRSDELPLKFPHNITQVPEYLREAPTETLCEIKAALTKTLGGKIDELVIYYRNLNRSDEFPLKFPVNITQVPKP